MWPARTGRNQVIRGVRMTRAPRRRSEPPRAAPDHAAAVVPVLASAPLGRTGVAATPEHAVARDPLDPRDAAAAGVEITAVRG